MRALLLLLASMTLPAVPVGAMPTADFFLAADGTQWAVLEVSSLCSGPVVLTLTLTPTDGGAPTTRVVEATETLAPDPCGIPCEGCAVTFAWTVVGDRVELAGQGTSGPGAKWSLTGRFDEGVLNADRGYDSPPPCLLCDVLR